MKARPLTTLAWPLVCLVAHAAAAPFHVITDFGAVADGKTLSTAASQKAVDACAAAGGGRVVIPAGRFVSGPVFLRSHLEVELSAGSVLLGSTNLADYPAVDGRWEGIERKIYASLFTGHHLEGVSITGRGTIDGRGSGIGKLPRCARNSALPRVNRTIRRRPRCAGRAPGRFTCRTAPTFLSAT